MPYYEEDDPRGYIEQIRAQRFGGGGYMGAPMEPGGFDGGDGDYDSPMIRQEPPRSYGRPYGGDPRMAQEARRQEVRRRNPQDWDDGEMTGEMAAEGPPPQFMQRGMAPAPRPDIASRYAAAMGGGGAMGLAPGGPRANMAMPQQQQRPAPMAPASYGQGNMTMAQPQPAQGFPRPQPYGRPPTSPQSSAREGTLPQQAGGWQSKPMAVSPGWGGGSQGMSMTAKPPAQAQPQKSWGMNSPSSSPMSSGAGGGRVPRIRSPFGAGSY